MNCRSLERLSLSSMLLMTLLTYFWGLGLVGSKVALRFLPPFLYPGYRFLIGSLILLSIHKLTSKETPASGKEWGRLAILGLIHTSSLYGFLYTGLDYITAGKTIVILNSQPFWIALFAPIFLKERRFNLAKVAGLVLGFMGVAVIFSEDILQFRPTDLKGGLFVLGGALSWSTGTIYAKRLMIASSSLLAVSTQMFIGAWPLIIIGHLAPSQPRLGFTPEAVALVVGLALFSTCVPYFLWFWLLKRNPSALLSSFNFLQIVFAVIMAYPILGEQPGTALILGVVLVSLGIFVVNRF